MKYAFAFYGLLLVYTIISWVVNLVTFFGCDFDPIGKEEIFKGLGLFIPPISWVSAWM
jgi:hypothetical protein